MPMTQSQIASELAKKTGTTKAQAKEMLEQLAALAVKETKSCGRFKIAGIGTMKKTYRKAREGRNPQTGKPLHIKAKTTATFSVSKAVKDELVGGSKTASPEKSAPAKKTAKKSAKKR